MHFQERVLNSVLTFAILAHSAFLLVDMMVDIRQLENESVLVVWDLHHVNLGHQGNQGV